MECIQAMERHMQQHLLLQSSQRCNNCHKEYKASMSPMGAGNGLTKWAMGGRGEFHKFHPLTSTIIHTLSKTSPPIVKGKSLSSNEPSHMA